MALVMQAEMWESYKENVTLTGMTHLDVKNAAGKTGMEVLTFPAQGEYTSGVKVVAMHHSLLKFALDAGPAGTMDAAMLTATYPDTPADVAELVVKDIATAYINYTVLYEPLVVCLGVGISDMFEIQPSPPAEDGVVDADFVDA